jgi:hypothetical protein
MSVYREQFFHRPPKGYRYLSPMQLAHVFRSLEQELEKAAEDDQRDTSGLTAWALRQVQQYQVSLSDIYQIFCLIRIRLGDNELALPTGFEVFLDRVMVKIIEVFNPANQRRIIQYASEIEGLAHELAAANEEADKALIKLHTLYEASRNLGMSLDTAEVMNRVVEQLTQATFAQSSAIWLDDKGFLRLVASYGLVQESGEETAVSLRETTSGVVLAFLTKGTLCLDVDEARLSEFDQQLLARLSAKKLRVLPLIVGEQVLGVVTLHSDDHYLDNDLDLVKTIVQQAAIAILRFLSMQAGKIY